MTTPAMTSVVQAMETQTKGAISTPQKSEGIYEELRNALAANTNSNESNTNAIRVLLEKIDSTSNVAPQETLSQKAFNVVKGVKENLNELKNYVEKFSNEKNPSTASLFEMEFKVIQFQLSLDVASKVGDKGSQAFQTLFRNQG